MAATDGQIVIAAARWMTEDALSLREFLSQLRLVEDDCSSPRCELVKFVRGQYSCLGVPNLPNPSLHSNAILLTLGRTLKVAAQSVKFKDGKRNNNTSAVSCGTRFAIPESYAGYFEILSEEGKAVKCIESVAELIKKFPECILVRDNIRGFVSAIPLVELSADKSRTINAGEILTLHKEVSLTARSSSSRNHRFLQCTDSKGDMVYLNVEQRGKFSPIARDDNISGVHTLRQLVSNKRLPLMVRLVWGPQPCKGGGGGTVHCSELRLISAFEEDSLFALPLGQHGKEPSSTVVALPSNCSLKLVRARNHEDLKNTDHFQRLSSTAARLARDINCRMTVLDTMKDNNVSFWNVSPSHSSKGVKASTKNYFLRRSVSHESYSHHHQIVVSPLLAADEPSQEEAALSVAPTQDFLEIDQIYDYVRGFAPLPKNLRVQNNFTVTATEEVLPVVSTSPPQPPPIETIPTKTHVAPNEKRSRQHQQRGGGSSKPASSKTALKMELHAQNLAQERPMGGDHHRVCHNHKQNRLVKSKTTSLVAGIDWAEQECSITVDAAVDTPKSPPVGGGTDLLSSPNTYLLTQADLLSPNQRNLADSSLLCESTSRRTLDVEPTYENTTQVYLECNDDTQTQEASNSSHRPLITVDDHHQLYRKQRATSEIAHSLQRDSSSPPSGSASKRSVHRKSLTEGCSVKTSKNCSVIAHSRKSNHGHKKSTSKSHEDLVLPKKEKTSSPPPKFHHLSSPECSPQPLTEVCNDPASPRDDSKRSKAAHRRRLSKQRSLTSLLADSSPHTPVIEHKPVELHLHLMSRPHHASGAPTRRTSKTERTSGKLGILYL